MKTTINVELSISEVDTILNALQRGIHSDLEFMDIENYALNPASENFQTFLAGINDMNAVYLKLLSISKENTEE